jgi:hypothetical protein
VCTSKGGSISILLPSYLKIYGTHHWHLYIYEGVKTTFFYPTISWNSCELFWCHQGLLACPKHMRDSMFPTIHMVYLKIHKLVIIGRRNKHAFCVFLMAGECRLWKWYLHNKQTPISQAVAQRQLQLYH